jgi:prepilin-type N-terminal cleavage/methylation domain-containing protein
MNVYTKKNSKRGISLIEIVVVLGIIGLIASAGLITARENRSATTLKNARATILLALEQSRSKAQTGYGTKNHGIRIKSNLIETFEGNVYTSGSGITIPLPPQITTNHTNTDIIFKRLRGSVASAATITVSHPTAGNLSITIDTEGNLANQ